MNINREFVMMPEFDRQWKRLGLGDEELLVLQQELLESPKAGDVLKGTGGLRKYRIAFPGRGKSGSGRVAYVDFTVYETIYLITAYPKSEKDNLSAEERKEIAKVIAFLEKGLKNRR
ncbi:MAG: type II toxin-antitoxin system RelE/ParE family toxin [Sphaerochaeta sp.]|nr:type II toxin-antitoxin system RelE/ParE family toxin [Sphaerochaeta sp.]